MADTTNQRILSLALGGFAPLDIAEFLNTTVNTVIAALGNLSIDGSTQAQRILKLTIAGHHNDDIAQWLGITVATVQAALQDLSTNPLAGTTTFGASNTTYTPAAPGYASAGSYGMASSGAYLAQINITQPTLLTGVAYQVGGAANGSALGSLYSSTGQIIASSAGLGQSNPGSWNRVPFTSQQALAPGQYFLGLQFTSASSTAYSVFHGAPATIASAVPTAPPLSFTVPTSGVASATPFMSTY